MMKKSLGIVVSTFLLLSLAWQISSKTYIFIQFSLNQEEIAKTLCENREKPKSCCEGKCVLEKEIKKDEKQDAKFPSALKEKIDKTEIFTGNIIYKMLFISCYISHHYNYKSETLKDVSLMVFHPPCFS